MTSFLSFLQFSSASLCSSHCTLCINYVVITVATHVLTISLSSEANIYSSQSRYNVLYNVLFFIIECSVLLHPSMTTIQYCAHNSHRTIFGQDYIWTGPTVHVHISKPPGGSVLFIFPYPLSDERLLVFYSV